MMQVGDVIAQQFCVDNDSYEGKWTGSRLTADGYMPADTYLEVFLTKVRSDSVRAIMSIE